MQTQPQIPVGQAVANQTMSPQQQPPTVMMVPNPAPSPPQQKMKCNSTTFIMLGSFQIVLGVSAMVFNIAAIIIDTSHSYAGAGIWCGVIFILAGAFQAVAGKVRSKCWIITSLVFCIIAAVMCVPLLGISAAGIASDKDNEYWARYNRDMYYEHIYDLSNPYPYYGFDDLDKYNARFAMNGVQVAIAVVEGIIAIVSAALGCKYLCGANNFQTTGIAHQVQYVPNPSQPGQQIIVLTPVAANPMQTVQSTPQVITIPVMNNVVQPGFTAPVLTTAGAPPAYSVIQAQPAPSGAVTLPQAVAQQPPPATATNPEKSTLP